MTSLAVSLALLVGSGCANGARHGEPPTAPQVSTQVSCPLGVPRAQVSVDETGDGVALTFTSEQVNELRTRARFAAASYGPGVNAGLGHDGQHSSGARHHGLRGMELPAYRASVTDVEGGARIDLVPEDAAERTLLVAKARAGVQKITTAPCQ